MPKRVSNSSDLPDIKPAYSPDAQEKRCIAYATRLAEQQLRDGTASSQVITHYLKLGASTTQLQKETLEAQKKLIDAKVEALKSTEEIKGLYAEAIRAFRIYGGDPDPDADSDTIEAPYEER